MYNLLKYSKNHKKTGSLWNYYRAIIIKIFIIIIINQAILFQLILNLSNIEQVF